MCAYMHLCVCVRVHVCVCAHVHECYVRINFSHGDLHDMTNPIIKTPEVRSQLME